MISKSSILAIMFAAVVLPSFSPAENMYTNSGQQYKITYVTTYKTTCTDVEKVKSVPTGKQLCEADYVGKSKSADFAGQTNCTPEMQDVFYTEPVCKTEKVVTEVKTPIAPPDDRGDGGQGDSPGT